MTIPLDKKQFFRARCIIHYAKTRKIKDMDDLSSRKMVKRDTLISHRLNRRAEGFYGGIAGRDPVFAMRPRKIPRTWASGGILLNEQDTFQIGILNFTVVFGGHAMGQTLRACATAASMSSALKS